MQFHTFGCRNNKKLLLMHGMLCDWQKFYDLLKPLEKDYCLIFPAMDGCYDGAPDFVSFADECAQIEAYIDREFGGSLDAVWGISQGATLMSELLARNRIRVKTAILDGIYLAHQGRWCADFGLKTFTKMQINGGEPTAPLRMICKLMGLDKSDMGELSLMYWGSSRKSMYSNLLENYTYHVNLDIAGSNTHIFLWCGSREPYAIKSHNILKKYLKHYEETIWPGMGHGKMIFSETEKYILNISDTIEQDFSADRGKNTPGKETL